MGCLKCGGNTADKQVFCKDCLDVMQQYPVKQDTPIQLPAREYATHEKKATPRREQTPAEQLGLLRRMVKWLVAIIVLLSLLLSLTGMLLIHTLNAGTSSNTIGQNYTTDTRRRP